MPPKSKRQPVTKTPMADEWEIYARAVIPKEGVQLAQYNEMRRCFFAGFYAALMALAADEHEDLTVEKADNAVAEMRAFCVAMNKGQA